MGAESRQGRLRYGRQGHAPHGTSPVGDIVVLSAWMCAHEVMPQQDHTQRRLQVQEGGAGGQSGGRVGRKEERQATKTTVTRWDEHKISNLLQPAAPCWPIRSAGAAACLAPAPMSTGGGAACCTRAGKVGGLLLVGLHVREAASRTPASRSPGHQRRRWTERSRAAPPGRGTDRPPRHWRTTSPAPGGRRGGATGPRPPARAGRR